MFSRFTDTFPIKKMQRLIPIIILWFGAVYFPANAGAAAQPSIDTVEMERQIHRLINRERQNRGLAALNWDKKLAAIARNHSLDMAKNHFFSHINLQEEDPDDRGKRQGLDEKKQIGPNSWAIGLAENIFLNNLYDKVTTTTLNGVTVKKEYAWKTQEEIARTTVQGWMNSPSHRSNILSPQYDRQGIGVAISGKDVYVTDDLF
jgi:uncharacterized protein YkwD